MIFIRSIIVGMQSFQFLIQKIQTYIKEKSFLYFKRIKHNKGIR